MIDSVNRVVLTVVGLALLAAAVAGGLAARGLLALARPETLFSRTDAAASSPEGLVVTAVAGVVVVGLGLWWVSRQITPPTSGLDTLTLDHRRVVEGSQDLEQGGRGRTTLDAGAVARAAAKDLASLPGVDDAGCRLVTAGARPRLRVRAEVLADADLHAVRLAAEEVYGRVCRVLGVESIHADVELRPRDRRPEQRVA